MKMKATEAPFFRMCRGMIEINPSPNTTPIKVTRHKAAAAPTNTDSGRPVLQLIRMAASWVLSPSSARKIVPNVVKTIFQSNVYSPFRVICFTETVFPLPVSGSLASFL